MPGAAVTAGGFGGPLLLPASSVAGSELRYVCKARLGFTASLRAAWAAGVPASGMGMRCVSMHAGFGWPAAHSTSLALVHWALCCGVSSPLPDALLARFTLILPGQNWKGLPVISPAICRSKC